MVYTNRIFKHLDKNDLKILYELEQDGRISLQRLAKATGLSKSFILYRLSRMEKNGILLRHVALVDMSKLGYQTYDIFLRIVNNEQRHEQEIIDYLLKKPEVQQVQRLIGKYQLYTTIIAHSIKEVELFLLDIVRKFGHAVVKYRLLLVYGAYSLSHNYLFDKPWIHQEKPLLAGKTIDIAAKERSLLAAISSNPRASITELAKNVRCSAITARKLLKQLQQKEVLLGVRPSLSPLPLGFLYKHMTMKMKFSGLAKLEEIRTYLLKLRCTRFLSYTFGNYDLTGRFVFKDMEEFRKFQDDFFSAFASSLDFVDYHDYFGTRKFVNMQV